MVLHLKLNKSEYNQVKKIIIKIFKNMHLIVMMMKLIKLSTTILNLDKLKFKGMINNNQVNNYKI